SAEQAEVPEKGHGFHGRPKLQALQASAERRPVPERQAVCALQCRRAFNILILLVFLGGRLLVKACLSALSKLKSVILHF
ncbi:MAG: hypothetical protein IK061_10690, partial [Desulfovibrio sp.]|nr:hypothetical protein [Desulfovibrio sp.]